MATLQNPTLDRLIKEVRIMLNQPKNTNSFWADDELTSYLNDAVSMYYHEVSERSEGQFDKSTDLNIVSGTETVALPSDCFEVKAVYKKRSTGYDMLEYRNNLTDGYETNSTTGADGWYGSYYFRVNNLVLRPIPNFNETAGLKIEYISFPESMIWGGDTLTSAIAPTFKELIVLYAVYKAKVKESLTTGTVTYTAVESLLKSCYDRFKDSVGYRSKYPTYVLPFNP